MAERTGLEYFWKIAGETAGAKFGDKFRSAIRADGARPRETSSRPMLGPF
jgi:hypothetical protein